jgi:hypothetical protein
VTPKDDRSENAGDEIDDSEQAARDERYGERLCRPDSPA